MTLKEISDRAAQENLAIFGAFAPKSEDLPPDNCKTLVLLGPLEPGFWAHIQTSPEFADGRPDPMDRWSHRVITAIAADVYATPVFPFGGPPFQPFIRWAMASGQAWQSPAGPLVHARAGMMVSYRGALALPYDIDLPAPMPRPCETCAEKPCLTACPVNALSAAAGYNLDRCHGHLDTAAGRDCMTQGCAARRACPVSKTYARLPAQSAFHMKSFHP